MDTLLVAIAAVGGITVLSFAMVGLAALGKRLRRTEPIVSRPVEAPAERIASAA